MTVKYRIVAVHMSADAGGFGFQNEGNLRLAPQGKYARFEDLGGEVLVVEAGQRQPGKKEPGPEKFYKVPKSHIRYMEVVAEAEGSK